MPLKLNLLLENSLSSLVIIFKLLPIFFEIIESVLMSEILKKLTTPSPVKVKIFLSYLNKYPAGFLSLYCQAFVLKLNFFTR